MSLGIGCYNPELDRYWVIDARIYQPDQDDKKKHAHLQDMMLNAVKRDVRFRTVLMDTWYAISRIMCWIDGLGYKFVCPIRSNRKVLDIWNNPDKPKYTSVKDIPWTEEEQKIGKQTKLRQCHLKLKLFRVTVRSDRIDYIVTNNYQQNQDSKDVARAYGFRWKIEQFHRESKQTTGISKCQARNSNAQRKHIIAAILAWISLNTNAIKRKISVYELKQEPLKEFQKSLWRSPHMIF